MLYTTFNTLIRIFNISHLIAFNQFISSFPSHCKFNIGTFMTILQLFYWKLCNSLSIFVKFLRCLPTWLGQYMGKRKLQSYPVNTLGFYSSKIMDMSACNTCGKSVKDRNSIKCNLCLTKVHLKCNYLNYVDSQYITFSNRTWHCYNCSKDLFPFTTISSLLSDRFYCNIDSDESCLTLKPPKNLSHLFNEFNSFSSDINNTPENVINSNYYDIDQLQTLKELTDKSFLSLFHLNTCSLSKNIDDFEHLIQSAKTDFDIMAVSESRITKNKLPPIDISIPNYNYKFCPTEASAGATLIYIRNHLSYKTRNDLKIYKSLKLESTFIEICNPRKTNIIIGRICKHPNMNINEFNDDYLNEFLDKLSKENKTIFLLGDFNISLLKVVSAKFLLVCFVCLKESNFEIRKNVFISLQKLFSFLR